MAVVTGIGNGAWVGTVTVTGTTTGHTGIWLPPEARPAAEVHPKQLQESRLAELHAKRLALRSEVLAGLASLRAAEEGRQSTTIQTPAGPLRLHSDPDCPVGRVYADRDRVYADRDRLLAAAYEEHSVPQAWVVAPVIPIPPTAQPDPLDARIDGVMLRDLIVTNTHASQTDNVIAAQRRSAWTPAQRAAVSAHLSAQLRAKVAASTAADRERERLRVVVDLDEP